MDITETTLMDLLEPHVWAIVKKTVGRMGGVVHRAPRVGELHGYDIYIDGGNVSFHMGTKYSLDISYKDPDFFEKLGAELERRLRNTMKLRTWPKFVRHLSKENPFIPQSFYKDKSP
jgi:hypothetical protein